jgi:hypothetical protein
LLVCGLALAVLVRLATTRRPGPALGVIGIVAVWLVFAQLGLYGGGDQGLVIKPLFALKFAPAGEQVLGRPSAANPWPTLIALAVLAVLSWLPPLAGAVGALRRGVRTDAGYALIAGIGISGAAALFAFGHPGQSEIYFIRSAEPYLALLAACGLAALLPGLDRRQTTILAAVAGALGAATVYAVGGTVGGVRPDAGLWPVARPFVVLFVVLAVLAVAICLVAVALRRHRRVTIVAVVALATLTALPTIASIPRGLASVASTGRLRNVRGFISITPSGGIKAARWLRDHSNPNDLVATNNHCLPVRGTQCDSRDFWIAAYAERRVLVEGWSYTDRATESLPLFGSGLGYAPYWDPALLAANDAVFTNPDTTNIAHLEQRYHVKWLVAVGPDVAAALGRLATLRYAAGQVSVYELPR